MNKNLERALREQRIRNNIKRKIQSSRQRELNESDLYKTFVEPFTDIIDSVKVSSKDIISNLLVEYLRASSMERSDAAMTSKESIDEQIRKAKERAETFHKSATNTGYLWNKIRNEHGK